MAAGKAPPAIVQCMVGRFRAHLDGDEKVLRSVLLRLASSNKIWSWPSNGIFHDVCKKRRKHDADRETEDCDIDFMYRGSENESP